MHPIFPDIEIDIPALSELTEIKNELQKTKTLLDVLQIEVVTNKLWREALEQALISYGIDLDQHHNQQGTSIKNIISSSASATFSTPIITSVQSAVPLVNQNESILGIQESDLQTTNNYQSHNGSPNGSPNDQMGGCSGLDLYPKRVLIKQEIHCSNRLIEEEEQHGNNNIENESTLFDLQNQNPSNEKEPEDMDINDVKSNLMSIIKENLHHQQEQLPHENPLQNSDPDSLSSDAQLFNPSMEINLSEAVIAATAVVHPQPTNINNTNHTNNNYTCKGSENSNVNTTSTTTTTTTNVSGNRLKQKRRRKRKTFRFTPVPKSNVIGKPRQKIPGPKSDPINYIDFLPGVVENETLFRCKFCPFIKNELNATIRHVHIKHLQERKYACPYCPQRFILHQHLENHITGRHTNRTNNARTNVASTSYPTTSSQPRQTNSVGDNMQDLYHPYIDDEKRDAFLCVPCGIISYHEDSMIKHIYNKHSDLLPSSKEKPATSSSFSSSSHNPTSTSQQTSFVCEHCLQKFISLPELEVHKGQCRKTFLFHNQSTSNDLLHRRADRNEGEEEEEVEDYVNCNININVDFPKQSRDPNRFNRIALSTVKKKKKIGGAGFWTFSEKMKEVLDEHIQNVRSSKPPYGCKLCGAVLTTRQSARRHVMGKHKYVHEGKDV